MTVRQIDALKARILAELPTQAKIAGADLAALIKNRVVQTGKNAEGQAFSPYSEKQVPAYLYYGKSRSQQAEQRVRARAKKREGVSYREFRNLNNLNTDVKNFEFTGSMWRGVGVQEQTKQGAVQVVVIDGDSQEVRNLLQYATDAERISIIKPSKSELKTVSDNLGQWMAGVIKSELT